MITSKNSLTTATQWALVVTLAFAGAACGSSSSSSSPTDAGKGGAGGSGTGTGGKGGSGTGTGGGAGGSNVDAGSLPGALATFETTNEGFALATYTPAAPYKNLADPNLGFTPAPTLTFDGTEGSPSAGSLKATAGYTDFNEFIDLQKAYPTTALLDWTGKTTLNVRVKVDSGFSADPSNPGGAQVYAQSYAPPATDGGQASFSYISNYNNVASTAAGMGYLVYSLPIAGAASQVAGTTWDPSKVVTFGIQLSTGGGGGTADGGVSVKPTPAVFHIDSFQLQ